MSVIDDLKEQLKRISSWPWKVDTEGWIDDSENYPFCEVRDLQEQDKQNVAFIACSPERIAALVEYVEAAEEYIEAWTNKERNIAAWQAVSTRLQAARKALGLE